VFRSDRDGASKRLVARPGSLPSWSHDGRWIYFNRSGGIWRVPADGGEAVRVVASGGNAIDSPDSSTVYYRRTTTPGVLFASPAAGGAETEVLTSMGISNNEYFPVEDGIYYVSPAPAGDLYARELRFFDLATRRSRTLFAFRARGGGGLSVSPDRKSFLYGGSDPAGGDDLMLIRNFR
jgi:Tol biopolymer transport system component